MATVCGLTTDNFFEYWLASGGNFIKAVQYVALATYNKNDIVYYAQVPYISLEDANTSPPLPMTNPPRWNQIAINSANMPVLPGRVASAMQKAQSEFNACLFEPTVNSSGASIQYNATPPVDTMTGFTNAQQGFILLSSHFLVCDLYASQFGGSPNNILAGVSVGGQSSSFKFPSNLENKRIFDKNNTEYGRQYNEMIAPFLRAQAAPFVVF